MFCPNCGKRVEDDALFCPDCGARIDRGYSGDTSEPEPAAVTEVTQLNLADADAPVTAAAVPVADTEIQPAPVPQPEMIYGEKPTPETHSDTAYESQPMPMPEGQPIQQASFAQPTQQMPPAPAPVPDPQPPAPAAPTQQMPPAPAAPAQQPAAIHTPKKNNAPRNIIIAVLALILVIGGGFGVNALLRTNRYKNAVATCENADTSFSSAETRDDYQNLLDQYQSACDDFTRLGDYQDSTFYADKCQEKIDLCAQNIEYIDAMELYDAGEFESAKTAFGNLGNFRDAGNMVNKCQNQIDFLSAQDLYEDGKYDEALKIFNSLKNAGLSEASEWCDKTNYAIADKLFTEGRKYEAWKIFNRLGKYSDSETRANDCKTPYPDTGVLYHNEGYWSSSVRLNIDGGNLSRPVFIKIYSGDTLVASLFINSGHSVTINLPAGNYTFRQATGSNWFGDTDMFGDEGTYVTLLFNNDTTSIYLQAGYEYQMTLALQTGGNVGAQSTNRGDF